MYEPWDIKTETTREADSLINFVLFCEDTVSEPLYFRYFQSHYKNIKINANVNQGNMNKNVINAILYCKSSGLIQQEMDELVIEDGTQVWCIFDRDKKETQEKIAKGNVEYDESIITAKRNGIHVAWSNDSFELWVLLHFEDVPLGEINRTYYYDRLTEIYRSLPDPNEDLQRMIQNQNNFNYKGFLKSERKFMGIVRTPLIERIDEAIERAEILESNFTDPELSNAQKAPMTLVHHLVKAIRDVGLFRDS